jgi:nucleotide-binding universal stress UspA family protein
MVFHHLLAPTDGSANSVQAAQLAFRIAHLCGASLTLVYVVDTAVLGELVRFAADQQTEMRRELYETGRKTLDHLESLARRSNLMVRCEICEGAPFEEIVALASRLGVDLIVMGHVGQRGPRRILIGSVTERVIEFAHCPVLVVKR